MRQQHLALLIAHREIVPAAVVEVADAGEVRTRSPSMTARGMTATSGRQLRSCEGGSMTHHATTPRYSTMKAMDTRRRRESQRAQIANAAKATANPRRSEVHGRFE